MRKGHETGKLYTWCLQEFGVGSSGHKKFEHTSSLNVSLAHVLMSLGASFFVIERKLTRNILKTVELIESGRLEGSESYSEASATLVT